MTPILIASIGSYPRTGEEKDQQRFPRALGHFERNEISAHALRDVEQSVTQEVIREQIEAGVDEVTDGLLTWTDPISRFCRNISGVKYGGLTRYFDNNFYYRVPILPAKSKIQPPTGVELKFARESSHKPVRAIITGPLTLAHHARGAAKPLDKLAARIDFFADVLAPEVASLAAQGAQVIQIDEPSLAAHPEDRALAEKAWAKLAAAKGAATLGIAIYFGPSIPLLDSLKDLPFGLWQLDTTVEGPALLTKLAAASPKQILGLGVVDGRTTRLEAAEAVADAVQPLVEKAKAERLYLTPSSGLEFLPRREAWAKLRRLVEARRVLQLAAGAAHG
ncbi:MAG: hypothetical protein JO102_06290 [Elusimicrobia bacterium]|nr:hypothetical protein [Elusimicrobiota bacterium]